MYSDSYLYDVEHDLIREPIALERFCILERDYSARFRTLLYESADQSVIVTHESR